LSYLLITGPDNIENKKTAKKSLSFVEPTDHSREGILIIDDAIYLSQNILCANLIYMFY
jgi:hypothetical protein